MKSRDWVVSFSALEGGDGRRVMGCDGGLHRSGERDGDIRADRLWVR